MRAERNRTAAARVQAAQCFPGIHKRGARPAQTDGAPVAADEESIHRCERERYVEYQMLLLRLQVAAFEQQFDDWLHTPQGRFATYYAARERLLVA
jgi:hypothetical protein